MQGMVSPVNILKKVMIFWYHFARRKESGLCLPLYEHAILPGIFFGILGFFFNSEPSGTIM